MRTKRERGSHRLAWAVLTVTAGLGVMKIGPLSYDLSLSLPQRWSGTPRSSSPWLRDSVACGANIALDKAASIFRFAASATPSPKDWLRIVGEITEANQLWSTRGWVDQPLVYHLTPPEPPRGTLERATSRGTEFEHLHFVSGYEPQAHEPGRTRWLDQVPNRIAHAWVFRHAGRPRPWLMCIHGYGLGLPFVDVDVFRVRWLYNTLGLNVVCNWHHPPPLDARFRGHDELLGRRFFQRICDPGH